MALAHSKTWSFTSQLKSYDDSADNIMRQWYFQFKELLVSMGWTVEGGRSVADGVHNNDQFDVWPTWQSVTHVSGDIWIHLKAPAALGFEIVYGAFYSSGNSQLYRMQMTVSQSAGYGTINGGANGTTTTGPTSTDMNTILAYTSSTPVHSQSRTFGIYGARTADNKNHRIMCMRGTMVDHYLSFEHLNNPSVDLDDGGRVFSWRYYSIGSNDPVNTILDRDFYTGTQYRGRVSGVNRSFYLGTPGYANLGMSSLRRVRDDQKMFVTPCDIYNHTTGQRSYLGTIPDMYYGNDNQVNVLLGDTVGGLSNWFSGGSIITPWNNAEPLPRFY